MATPRATQQAAATGSAVQAAAVASATKPTVTDPTTGTSVTAVSIHRARGPVIRNEPPPLYRPMLTPGHPAKVGVSMSRVTITPLNRTTAAGDPNPYQFVFHLNPDQVALSASVNPGVKLTSEVDTTTRNILQVGGSIVISGLIDRQQEIWANSRSKHKGPGGTVHFRDFGTLYDIEWLYRVFNGDPKAKANQQIAPLVANQTNYGYLFPTTVEIFLNKTSRFLAFPVSFDMAHQKYTPAMVPMITTFDLTMVVAAKGTGARADVVSGGGSQVPDWASALTPSVNGTVGRASP